MILRRLTLAAVAVLLILVPSTADAEDKGGVHRLGLGVLYWQTVDDLAGGGDIEDDGLSLVASYQYGKKRGLISFEIDLEYFNDGFGGSGETTLAPVAFVLIGNQLYVGAGIGVSFSSGLEDDVSDPFYAGRLGYQFDVLPGLRLDVNLNYRTNAFGELDDFDSDTLTAGAFARIKLK